MADGLGFGGGLCRHGSQRLAERVSCQADPEKQLAGQLTLNSLPSYFPVGGAKPRYFYRKKVAIGGAEVSLTGAYAGSDMVCLFADASGVYWFKGNRGQIEKIGSQDHFKKLLRQISLNKLEESSLLVKKTKTEKKKMNKKTTKKTEKQSSKKKAE